MRLRQVELFMILCALGVLGVIVIWFVEQRPRLGHSHTRCISNLKQLALGQKIWAGENSDKYPFEISTNSGGTKEYVQAADTFRHFAVMSNEMGSPKVLTCPMDASRQPIYDFASLSNGNISYFINLAARENGPLSAMSGDRNLQLSVSGTNTVVKWGSGLHEGRGFVALTDGSVWSASYPKEILRLPSLFTNAQLRFPP